MTTTFYPPSLISLYLHVNIIMHLKSCTMYLNLTDNFFPFCVFLIFESEGTLYFHFQVKFFVTDPSKLLEEFTRYQYVLQLKKNLREGV